MKVDYLLASDFLIARWAEGADSAADRWLQNHADARLGIPWIVKGELLRAAVAVGLSEREVAAFLDRYPTLPADEETLRLFALVAAEGMSESELWLVASALRWDVPLVTNSLREVPELQIERY